MRRVPVSELLDLERLGPEHREPTPAEIRNALPPGWILEDDGITARTDLRLFFRQGWILALALVSFGTVVLGVFWSTFPSGGRGILRFATLIAVVLLAGGLVAPRITRALTRR